MIRTEYFYLLFIVLVLLSASQTMGQQSATMLQSEAERHIQAGRFSEAINLLSELIIKRPRMAEAYVMRGKCYEKRSQYKLAVEDLQKANNLNPNNKDTKEYLDKLKELWNNELVNKIDKLEKELSLNPNLADNYNQLAELYLDTGEKEKAVKSYKKYMDMVELSPKIALRYGDFLAENNMLKEGESSFEKYVTMFPQDELIKNKYGYFNLWLGNFKKAEDVFASILKIDPNFKEAQEGYKQAKAKGYFEKSGTSEEIKSVTSTDVQENKIENDEKILADNPGDYRTRLGMINELIKSGRFEESFDQIQIILKDTLHIPVFSTYRASLTARRDSVFNLIINNYKDKLKTNPNQKDIISKIAYYYSSLGNYDSAMNTLSNYFTNTNSENTNDLKFQYAKYASWKGDFKKSLDALNSLLNINPGNFQYQLLKAKVLVWSNKDLGMAEIYLQNNLKAGNQSLEVILTLATLYIQGDQLSKAKNYIDWAKTIDPKSDQVVKVEELYNDHSRLLAEQRIYALIDDGREFIKESEYKKALVKFDEYFSKIKNPSESELLEYADLYNRLNNLDKANEIYNRILQKDKDNYEVEKLRAKNMLWKKDYKSALAEFEKLSSENPGDYECKVLLGESYQNLGQYSMANLIYADILKNSTDKKILEIVNKRMEYMPQTGFKSLFSNFPSPIGFTPAVIYYSDNQDFSLSNVGGRIEVGIAKMLSGGISYSNAILQSSLNNRSFAEFKAHLFVNISNQIHINGSYGTLNSINRTKQNIGDALIKYTDKQTFSAELSYNHSNAAMIFYSPHLINLGYYADVYKASGFFEQTKKLYLSGYFSYLSVSDGNVGNDFMLRIGSELIKDAFFGYEARYINYKYNSPFVPYSNQSLRLYYAPQNLDSHSLWTEWKLINNKALKFQFDATVGYIPLYNIVLRQVGGDIKYSPFGKLILNLQLSTGSSYRFDSSYNYFSGLITIYWQVYN